MDRSLLADHPALEPHLAGAADAQRARVLEGMTLAVAEKGYAATTVADVVRAARVSRSTFYERFASKEACFLEAYRHGVDVLIARVRAAVHDLDGDWRAQLRAGIRAYLHALAEEPRFARTYLLEIHAAGPAALDARAEALRRFADRYAASAAQAGHHPDPVALLVLCAGTEQLAAEHVRAGNARGLAALEDVFCRIAEAVVLGVDTP